MIIDLILDRKDGQKYSPKKFYNEVMQYSGLYGEEIAAALDGGSNNDIKNALCRYVVDNEYNEDICEYIQSVKWL